MSAFSDLNLLLEFGGRVRSEVEFRSLLRSAGFTVRHLVREPDAPLVILEAWPVSSTDERESDQSGVFRISELAEEPSFSRDWTRLK